MALKELCSKVTLIWVSSHYDMATDNTEPLTDAAFGLE